MPSLRIALFMVLVVLPILLLVLYFLVQYALIVWSSRYMQKVAGRYRLNYSPPSLFLYPSVAGEVGDKGVHITIARQGIRRYLDISIVSGKGMKRKRIGIFRLKKADKLLRRISAKNI